MKRQSWAKRKAIKRTAISVMALCMALSLLSCRTSSGTDHDQIVKSAIDLAQTYNAMQEYDRALAVYDKALSQARDYRLYYNYALTLAHSGQCNEAMDFLESSYSEFPEKVEFLRAKAVLQKETGDLEGALDSLSRILEKCEDESEKKALSLEIIELLIKTDQSESAYEKALALWDQGIMEKDVIEVLFLIEPQKWQNTYNLIVK